MARDYSEADIFEIQFSNRVLLPKFVKEYLKVILFTVYILAWGKTTDTNKTN